ncbi:MAG: hypothetical protein ABIU09_05035 [Pyrinomonadaceae bacterium]
MYRRPKFLEVLIEIRQEMAREADYDVDLFAEIVRSGERLRHKERHSISDPHADQDESAPRRSNPSKKAGLI